MCRHRCNEAEHRYGSLTDKTRAPVSLLGKAQREAFIRHAGDSMSTVSASKLEGGSCSC